MGAYYDVIEWLIVAASDNPPTGMANTTAIVTVVWQTDRHIMLNKWENRLVGPTMDQVESCLSHHLSEIHIILYYLDGNNEYNQ
jgi:hypothetical protein